MRPLIRSWLRTGAHCTAARSFLALCIAVSAIVVAAGAWATEARPLAQDEALEARVMSIAGELRCLVCQNETLAASHAGLAVDLREQIRDRLKSGQTQQQISDYMVERYGEFVLYRPRFSATTLLLWLGPFVLLATAFIVLARGIGRRNRNLRGHASERELGPGERARARRLLGMPGERGER